jgi:hypothetical protein
MSWARRETLFPVIEPPGSGGIDCRAVPQELDIKIAREAVKRVGGSISRLRPEAVGVRVCGATSKSLACIAMRFTHTLSDF